MQLTTFLVAALSMGSAIAGPLVGVRAFDDVAAVLATARSDIHSELLTINVLVQQPSNAVSVTKIQNCLVNVGQSLNTILTPAVALAASASTPLSKAQLSVLSRVARDFQGVFADVDVLGKKITGSALSRDQLIQVRPELQWVLSTVAPVSRPILAFVDVAAPGSAKDFRSVTPALVDIQALVNLGVGVGINV
ncbi:hypothetical protein F4802DRAFT_289308 [Xylaria palmicola]|nr:hypothetical protein F4802DRAFT_289308 [Xylaria palmicola]